MGTYAALGAAIAMFSFALSFFIRYIFVDVFSFQACAYKVLSSLTSLAGGLRMFKASLWAVLHSAVAFFDTTPMGMQSVCAISTIPLTVVDRPCDVSSL